MNNIYKYITEGSYPAPPTIQRCGSNVTSLTGADLVNLGTLGEIGEGEVAYLYQTGICLNEKVLIHIHFDGRGIYLNLFEVIDQEIIYRSHVEIDLPRYEGDTPVRAHKYDDSHIYVAGLAAYMIKISGTGSDLTASLAGQSDRIMPDGGGTPIPRDPMHQLGNINNPTDYFMYTATIAASTGNPDKVFGALVEWTGSGFDIINTTTHIIWPDDQSSTEDHQIANTITIDDNSVMCHIYYEYSTGGSKAYIWYGVKLCYDFSMDIFTWTSPVILWNPWPDKSSTEEEVASSDFYPAVTTYSEVVSTPIIENGRRFFAFHSPNTLSNSEQTFIIGSAPYDKYYCSETWPLWNSRLLNFSGKSPLYTPKTHISSPNPHTFHLLSDDFNDAIFLDHVQVNYDSIDPGTKTPLEGVGIDYLDHTIVSTQDVHANDVYITPLNSKQSIIGQYIDATHKTRFFLYG